MQFPTGIRIHPPSGFPANQAPHPLDFQGWSRPRPAMRRDEPLLGVDVVIDREKGEFETAVDSEFVEDMGQVVLDSLFTE